jgi:GntR family transcriptional regulator, transcriptional repressor for pyruvate dehydrogenase complex
VEASGSREPFIAHPIQTLSAAAQIAQQLRNAIVSDQLPPGYRLPSEAELAAEYHVSRGTIRETIKILAAQRLVESTRGAKGGTTVRHPEPKEVAEAMADSITLWFNAGSTSLAQVNDARAWIEHGCVVLASQDRDDDDLENIRRPVEAMEVPGVDIDDMLALDIVFHDAVCRAAHNPVMELAMTAIHAVRPYTNAMIARLLEIAAIASQHRAIYEAIAERDEHAATEAFERHVTYLHEVRMQALADRRPEDISIESLEEMRPSIDRIRPRSTS